MTNENSSESKQELYENIVSSCENLRIAKYLKDEIKDILKLFHFHKLSNIKKNESDFLDYLKIINDANCNKIKSLSSNNLEKKNLNNSLSYYYDCDNIVEDEILSIKDKIACNAYEIFTLMQCIKWYLVLTIDEFCNATNTRMDILHYKKSKTKIF